MLLSKSTSASQGESLEIKIADLTFHLSKSLAFTSIFVYSCQFLDLAEFADNNFLSQNLQ